MGAMLEMMGQMTGKKPGKGEAETAKGGEGAKGTSDSANTANKGKIDDPENNQERRVPRAAGKSGSQLPPEFQKALDGYNKNTTPK